MKQLVLAGLLCIASVAVADDTACLDEASFDRAWHALFDQYQDGDIRAIDLHRGALVLVEQRCRSDFLARPALKKPSLTK